LNAKKSRRLRQMVDCYLGRGTDQKTMGVVEMEERTIAQIQPDGKHTFRDERRKEARTMEERYLYRQLKKVYNRTKDEPELRKTLVNDLLKTAESTAETKGDS